MFHKHDMDDFMYDAEDADDDDYNNDNVINNNPVGPDSQKIIHLIP